VGGFATPRLDARPARTDRASRVSARAWARREAERMFCVGGFARTSRLWSSLVRAGVGDGLGVCGGVRGGREQVADGQQQQQQQQQQHQQQQQQQHQQQQQQQQHQQPTRLHVCCWCIMMLHYDAALGCRPRGAPASNPLLTTSPLPRTLHPTPRGVEIAPEMARGTPAMAATSFLPMLLPATSIPTHYLSAARTGAPPPPSMPRTQPRFAVSPLKTKNKILVT
jgi:hypothetical protein